MKLYNELAHWWPLMSPPEEYDEEAAAIGALLDPEGATKRVLELGSGGGHLASHLKARFRMTLVDVSPRMLDMSRSLNPDCRHLQGDMRSLRMGETFDAVLIHDAVCHLSEAGDLQAALNTARAHLDPGGVAVFCPDQTLDIFTPDTSTGGTDGADRGMRFLGWTHPEVTGTSYRVDLAYLLRDADGSVRVEHDHMTMGIFSREHWKQALISAGFEEPGIYTVSSRDVLAAKASS